MQSRLIKTLGITISSLFLQGLFIFLFKSDKQPGIPAHWNEQFISLMLVAMVCTVLIHFLPRGWVIGLSIVCRAVSTFLIIQAMPEQIFAYSILLALLILETFLVTTRWRGLALGLLLTVLLIWQRVLNDTTWNFSHPAPRYGELMIPWIQCMSACMIGFALRVFMDRNREKSRRMEHFQKASIRLVEANVRLQEYTLRAQRESIVNERNRISREMHDSVGYILTNLIAVLDLTKKLVVAKHEDAVANLDTGRELAREALTDVRQAVRALRPPVEVNHLQAIPQLTAAFTQATGIAVSLELPEPPFRLGEEYEWLIYRVIQEALTNTFRHGRASEVFVTLMQKMNRIYLTIQDNGLGTATIIPGCGIVGIRERVEDLGGGLTTESAPGRGFTIRIWLPAGGGVSNGSNPDFTG